MSFDDQTRLVIRLAREDDKAAVNELRRQVLSVHAAKRPEVFPSEFSREYANYLDIVMMQENAQVLVAEWDGRIVGFTCLEYMDRPGTCYRMPMHACHVMEFGVAEQYRRQGIGRALFDDIRTRAEARGFRRIELGVWEFNESALRFYESLGFHTSKREMEYP